MDRQTTNLRRNDYNPRSTEDEIPYVIFLLYGATVLILNDQLVGCLHTGIYFFFSKF